MEIFWLMGDFLEQGKIKKQKVNKDIKQRGVLLASYKNTINKFSFKRIKTFQRKFRSRVSLFLGRHFFSYE